MQGDSCHDQADMVTEVYGHIPDEDRKKKPKHRYQLAKGEKEDIIA